MAVAPLVFTCRPFAIVPNGDGAADRIKAVLIALETDERALDAVCGFEYDSSRLHATFRIEIPAESDPGLAAGTATEVFNQALETAGLEQRAAGVAIVEGADPGLLP